MSKILKVDDFEIPSEAAKKAAIKMFTNMPTKRVIHISISKKNRIYTYKVTKEKSIKTGQYKINVHKKTKASKKRGGAITISEEDLDAISRCFENIKMQASSNQDASNAVKNYLKHYKRPSNQYISVYYVETLDSIIHSLKTINNKPILKRIEKDLKTLQSIRNKHFNSNLSKSDIESFNDLVDDINLICANYYRAIQSKRRAFYDEIRVPFYAPYKHMDFYISEVYNTLTQMNITENMTFYHQYRDVMTKLETIASKIEKEGPSKDQYAVGHNMYYDMEPNTLLPDTYVGEPSGNPPS